MWKPEHPITYGGQLLDDRQAWVYTFARAWEAREPDPEDLNFMALLNKLGAEIVDEYGDQDPVAVANRTFGTDEFADWMPEIYSDGYVPEKTDESANKFDDLPF